MNKYSNYSPKSFKQVIGFVPLCCLYAVFIGGSILLLVQASFADSPVGTLSFASYQQVLQSEIRIESVVFSLGVATISAFLASVLGLRLAYAIFVSQKSIMKRIVQPFATFGMMIPYSYLTFILLTLLSKSGLISRVLLTAGLIDTIDQFPQIMYASTGLGMMLVFILKGCAFMTIFSLAALQKIAPILGEQAAVLGANHQQRLRLVFLPLIANTFIWGSTILFVYFLGSFELPYLLPTQIQPLAMSFYRLYLSANLADIPLAMAFGVIFFFISSIGAASYAWLVRKAIRWQQKL